MIPGRCILLGLQFITLLFLSPCANAAIQQNETSAAVTVLRIDALGAGMASVGGEWQFHLGDDPAWADPSLDDSRWEQLTADRTWGSQRHPGYIGYAWYRRHLDLRHFLGLQKGGESLSSFLHRETSGQRGGTRELDNLDLWQSRYQQSATYSTPSNAEIGHVSGSFSTRRFIGRLLWRNICMVQAR